MANWNLTKGLQTLRAQINEAFPDRDKASDGTIGDAAHQASTSSHNPDDTRGATPEWNGDADANAEVRAWDMDADLRGVSAQVVVDHIRKLPGVSSVLRYMIYNRKIYRASNGWKAETYTGASPHTEHVHFTGAYTQAADNNVTFNYRLEDIPMALNAADKNWIAAQIKAAVDDLLGVPIDDQAHAGRTVGDVLRDVAKLRGVLVGDPADAKNAALAPTAPVAQILALPGALEELEGKVDQVLTAVTTTAPSA